MEIAIVIVITFGCEWVRREADHPLAREPKVIAGWGGTKELRILSCVETTSFAEQPCLVIHTVHTQNTMRFCAHIKSPTLHTKPIVLT